MPMTGFSRFDWLPTPSQHFLVVTFALLVYVLTTRARREQRAPPPPSPG